MLSCIFTEAIFLNETKEHLGMSLNSCHLKCQGKVAFSNRIGYI